MSGRWIWCPEWWKVVPVMGDKSWLGDSGSVPTVSEWEEAVRNAPEPPDTRTEEIVVITGGLGEEWVRLQRELSEARAALRDADDGLEQWLRTSEIRIFREKHSAALKAAREGK